jgi:GNAT superfamily N-acetyltransferase
MWTRRRVILCSYKVTKDKNEMKLAEVINLMGQVYWAKNRSVEKVKKAMDNSKCYGVIDVNGVLVGFARVMTDYATAFYLSDVIVDESHRGLGISRMIMDAVNKDEELQGLLGILITKTAQGLYEKYGYESSEEELMILIPSITANSKGIVS